MPHQSTRTTAVCETCGTTFPAKPSHMRRGHDRFCSRACYGEARRPPLILVSVVGPHGCWVPECGRSPRGYSLIHHKNRAYRGHRLMYEKAIGPIPAGHDLHHAVCENPPCINPGHVVPMTPADHARLCPRIAANIHKTHCPAGHPYAGDNLILDKRGRRFCRECGRTKAREYARRKRWEAKMVRQSAVNP